jgi:hypothetical protein
MATPTTIENITDEQIEALKHEAAQAGDDTPGPVAFDRVGDIERCPCDGERDAGGVCVDCSGTSYRRAPTEPER